MGKVYNRHFEYNVRKKLRNNMTRTEIILWSQLKGKKLNGQKFRRQYSVGPYIVDFYHAKKRLAIEIDGESHFKKGAKEYDDSRQNYIESYGITFLRFLNSDIYKNLDSVLDTILNTINNPLLK